MSKGLKYALIYTAAIFCLTLVIRFLIGDSDYISSSITRAIFGGFGIFVGYGIGISQDKSSSK